MDLILTFQDTDVALAIYNLLLPHIGVSVLPAPA
jgi:hypothetical protein